jgi:cell shape-determining protein MreD
MCDNKLVWYWQQFSFVLSIQSFLTSFDKTFQKTLKMNSKIFVIVLLVILVTVEQCRTEEGKTTHPDKKVVSYSLSKIVLWNIGWILKSTPGIFCKKKKPVAYKSLGINIRT